VCCLSNKRCLSNTFPEEPQVCCLSNTQVLPEATPVCCLRCVASGNTPATPVCCLSMEVSFLRRVASATRVAEACVLPQACCLRRLSSATRYLRYLRERVLSTPFFGVRTKKGCAFSCALFIQETILYIFILLFFLEACCLSATRSLRSLFSSFLFGYIHIRRTACQLPEHRC
jgi:hypothetical protein